MIVERYPIPHNPAGKETFLKICASFPIVGTVDCRNLEESGLDDLVCFFSLKNKHDS